MEKDKVYLQHLIDEVNRISKFLEGVRKEEFVNSQEITEKHYAIVRSLEIIGEAASKVSQNTKDKNEDIPWRLMSDMRNKVIHEYMNVDYDVVWETSVNDLPPLKDKFVQILNN